MYGLHCFLAVRHHSPVLPTGLFSLLLQREGISAIHYFVLARNKVPPIFFDVLGFECIYSGRHKHSSPTHTSEVFYFLFIFPHYITIAHILKKL